MGWRAASPGPRRPPDRTGPVSPDIPHTHHFPASSQDLPRTLSVASGEPTGTVQPGASVLPPPLLLRLCVAGCCQRKKLVSRRLPAKYVANTRTTRPLSAQEEPASRQRRLAHVAVSQPHGACTPTRRSRQVRHVCAINATGAVSFLSACSSPTTAHD